MGGPQRGHELPPRREPLGDLSDRDDLLPGGIRGSQTIPDLVPDGREVVQVQLLDLLLSEASQLEHGPGDLFGNVFLPTDRCGLQERLATPVGTAHLVEQVLGEASLVGRVPGFHAALVPHPEHPEVVGDLPLALRHQQLGVEVGAEDVRSPLEPGGPDDLPDLVADLGRVDERLDIGTPRPLG